jgi:hypothetical protein
MFRVEIDLTPAKVMCPGHCPAGIDPLFVLLLALRAGFGCGQSRFSIDLIRAALTFLLALSVASGHLDPAVSDR